ncbi:MAG: glycosyltransferase [Patescibacteria group bacterium]
MPKVSVIMSVYNGEKYLSEAIESILVQTFKDFEFIIIDDASIDNSFKIIEKYKNKDNRIILLKNQENLGLTKSLNKAIKIAKGDYIARMDADDVSVEDRLEKQINFLENNKNIDLIGTDVEFIDNNKLKHTLIFDKEKIKKVFFHHNPMIHPTWMFKKEILKKINYDEKYLYAQDYKFLADLLKNDFIFTNLDDKLLKFRLAQESISQKKNVLQRYYSLEVRRFLFKNNLYPKYKKIFLFRQYLKYYYLVFKNKLEKENTAIFLSSLRGGGFTYIKNFLDSTEKKYFIIAKDDNKENLEFLIKHSQVKEIFIYKSFLSIFKIINFVKRNKIKVFYSQGVRVIIFARIIKLFLPKIILINIFHGYFFVHYKNLLKRKIFLFLEKVFYFLDNGQIFLTESDRNFAKKNKSLAKNNVIIANEINFPEKLDKNFANQVLNIGFLGRWRYEKGIDIFLEIIEKLNNKNSEKYNFYLKGDGDFNLEVENINKKYNNVNLEKFDNNIKDFFTKIDLLIFPSRHEGLPITILEAGAYGVPVLASNVCGNRDLVINNKTGFLVDVNVDNFVEKIENLDNLKLKDIAENARINLLEKNSKPQRMTQKTEEFIFGVVNKK